MAEETAAAQAAGIEPAATLEQAPPAAKETDKPADSKGQDDSAAISTRLTAAEKLARQSAEENKTLREELDKLRRAHLSDEELREDDRKRKDEELTERESKLRESENRFYTVQALKKAGLDDGSENSLKLVDLITGGALQDQGGIDTRIKAVSVWLKQHDKELTDKLFKANGRTPGEGSSSTAGASGLGVRAAQRYAQKLHLGGK